MCFFSKFLNALKGKPPGGSDRYITIYVSSNRCRELIMGQIDLMNEVSLADEGGTYYVRKVLHTSGKDHCFGQVEIEVWLDQNKKVARHEVHGGRWLTLDEYDAELAKQAEEAAQAPEDAEKAQTTELDT